ncbi:MAG: hypothetical protein KME07_14030 [Pegethrix bostrychoides GSE-TBD4-15B]|uniref:Uncharacterized protein n=1 Tax=Pegethrix bostrychoides GSE-TBD4-15B TaxID=2839662 RepID=A0A951PBR3_9CYAN|nr:hypothetical protein [Pegethrix bostrychoides GSE-TBD4-15B]
MADPSSVELTVAFNDPNLDLKEREAQTLNLWAELQDRDEVEALGRVPDPNPPAGYKGGSFLMGLLTAEVSLANFRKLLGFLAERLGNKPIKLKVKAPDGRELELEASSQDEFNFAYQKAQDFLKGS